jgi:dihydropyrimidinase
MSIIIQNGRIITADRDFCADIFIENERITAIGAGLIRPADLTIDATAKLVIPGGVDVHTHLDMPYCGTVSSDDFETGTRAAAFGGTTCLIDFAIQSRGMSLPQALDIWLRKAEKATVDYGLHMIVTDLPEMHLADIDEMIHAGVTSFKLFMAYPDTLMVDDATILRAMRRAAAAGGMVCIHAEDGAMIELLVRAAIAAGKTAPIHHALTRPVAAEAEAVHRTIRLAQSADATVYIVHLSTAEALIMVAEARARGLRVFAETCPQYLLVSIEDLDRPGFEGAKYVFSPPPRAKSHQGALWRGLRENDLQVVATDHCPVFLAEKLAGARQNFAQIPNGGPGIEHRLQLLFHYGVSRQRISLNRWVEITATAPAKIFGLYPRKGTIAVGSDADVVIWNPGIQHTISAQTHHMRVDYSMFEGLEVRGIAETVIARGKVLVAKGDWSGAAGQGQFIKRGSCGL